MAGTFLRKQGGKNSRCMRTAVLPAGAGTYVCLGQPSNALLRYLTAQY